MEVTQSVLEENEARSLMFLISDPGHRSRVVRLQGFPLAVRHTHTLSNALINHKHTQTKGEAISLFISSCSSGPDRPVRVGGGQWEWEAEGQRGAGTPRPSPET